MRFLSVLSIVLSEMFVDGTATRGGRDVLGLSAPQEVRSQMTLEAITVGTIEIHQCSQGIILYCQKYSMLYIY